MSLQSLNGLIYCRKNALSCKDSTMSKLSKALFSVSILTLLVLFTIVSLIGCNENHGVKINEKAPSISGVDIYGKYETLSQFKGNVIVLYFWTNSCCGEKLKQLEPYYEQNRHKGLTILAINENNSKEVVEAYAKANSLTFSLQTAEMGMVAKEYGVFGFPTIFIIDREGVIRKKILGYVNIEQLANLVSQILVK